MASLFNMFQTVKMSVLRRVHARSSKQEAVAMWARGLAWDDAPLMRAMQEHYHGKRVFHVIAPGGIVDHAHNSDHFSMYRVLERHPVAEHLADIVINENAWAQVHDDVVFYARCAHIEHGRFWATVGKKLNHDERSCYWGTVLHEAAQAGNTVPFDWCRPDVLRWRAASMSSLHSDGGYGVLHPDVVAWLVQQGLWTQNDVAAQINPHSCPMAGIEFMGMTKHLPYEGHYMADACEGVLRNYAPTLDQKVRFVGQAMLALGPGFWNVFLGQRLAPYLGDVEVDVLRAVCGHSVFTYHYPDKQLYDALQSATQAPMEAFDAQDALSNHQAHPSRHAGLRFLMDFDPPKDRLELYHLGAMALRIQRGQVKEPETLVLPVLGAG